MSDQANAGLSLKFLSDRLTNITASVAREMHALDRRVNYAENTIFEIVPRIQHIESLVDGCLRNQAPSERATLNRMDFQLANLESFACVGGQVGSGRFVRTPRVQALFGKQLHSPTNKFSNQGGGCRTP